MEAELGHNNNHRHERLMGTNVEPAGKLNQSAELKSDASPAQRLFTVAPFDQLEHQTLEHVTGRWTRTRLKTPVAV